MSDLLVAMTLAAKDEASRPVKRATDNVTRGAKEAAAATSRLINDTRKMASAREALNIRSEHSIQREIQQTEAAYKRLQAAGTLSAREQARAYDAMRGKVSALRQEMGQVSRAQALMQKVSSVKNAAMSVGAGALAAGYVMMQPAKRQMSSEMQYGIAANDIYEGRDVAGRKEAIQSMRTRAESLDKYGGDKSEALQTWRGMVGSGSFGSGEKAYDKAYAVMPQIMQASVSNGISPQLLGQYVSKAKKTMGLKDGEEGWIIDSALRGYKDAGADGEGFIQNLYSQMDTARVAGYSGKSGLNSMISQNVVLAQKTGSGEAAGERLRALNLAITSDAVRKAVLESKARTRDEKTGKMEHIDLTKTYMEGSRNGVDNQTSFYAVMREVLKQDKNYKALMAQASKLKGEDREKFLDDNMDVIAKTALGKMGLQKEVLRTAVTGLFNGEAMKTAQERGMAADGQTATDWDTVKDLNQVKVDAAKNVKESAEDRAIKPFSDALGTMSGKLVEYSEKYPGLSTALAGATISIKALGAAAAASSVMNLLSNKGLGGIGGLGGKGGVPGLPGGGSPGMAGGVLQKAGVAGVLAYTGLEVARAAGLPDVDQQKGVENLRKGEWLNASANLSAGDFIGAVWDKMRGKDPLAAFNKDSGNDPVQLAARLELMTAEIQKMQSIGQTITIHNNVNLDGQQLSQATNTVNSREAKRYGG